MTLDLYELRWEHRFMADCRLIHPDQSVLDRAVAGITIALERRPEIFQLFDKDRRLRVASVLYHVASGPSAIHVEPLFATFRIEKPRPGGLVSLRSRISSAARTASSNGRSIFSLSRRFAGFFGSLTAVRLRASPRDSLSVGQSLALSALERQHRSLSVAHAVRRAVVVAEVELCEISRQVGL